MQHSKEDDLRELKFDDGSDIVSVKIKRKFVGAVITVEWEAPHWDTENYHSKARITVEKDIAYLSPSLRSEVDSTVNMTASVQDDLIGIIGEIDDNR